MKESNYLVPTQLVHMILLLGTTGSLGDIEIIHLHSLIDMATVVAPAN